MMDRVRSSQSTSGGVEVTRRGVAGRLQPTLGVGLDVRVRSLEPIVVLSYLLIIQKYMTVNSVFFMNIWLKRSIFIYYHD